MNRALQLSRIAILETEASQKKLLGQRRFFNHLVAGMKQRRSKRIAGGVKRKTPDRDGDSSSSAKRNKSASAIEGATLTNVLQIPGVSQQFQEYLKGDMSAPSNQIRKPALFVIFETKIYSSDSDDDDSDSDSDSDDPEFTDETLFRLEQLNSSEYLLTKNLRSALHLASYTINKNFSDILSDLCKDIVELQKHQFRKKLNKKQFKMRIYVKFVFSEINVEKINETSHKEMVLSLKYNTQYMGLFTFLKHFVSGLMADGSSYEGVNKNPETRKYLLPVEVDLSMRNLQSFTAKNALLIWKRNEYTLPREYIEKIVFKTWRKLLDGKIKIRPLKIP